MDILGVVNALRHHCSTVWVYNRNTHKVFVHQDVYQPNLEGKEFFIDELADFYKENCLFDGDYAVWNKHLNADALEECFSESFTDATFTLRFTYSGVEPRWYKCVVQKFDEERLLLFDRDMYDKVKEISFQNNMEQYFGNVLYIDVETGQYLSHKNEISSYHINRTKQYDVMIAHFAERYIMHPEPLVVSESMSIKHVKKMLAKEARYSLLLTVRSKSDRPTYTRAVFSYLDSSEKTIVLAYTDISDIAAEYEQQVQHYRLNSNLDSLTGVYNRNYYEEKLKDKKLDCGVAVIDVDDFKLCNDIFGHPGGDAALVSVVARIRDNMHENDLLVRFGGDEFLLILHAVGSDRFDSRLVEIRDRIHTTEVSGYSEMVVSVSIGGVLLKENETVEAAVMRADRLMYRAKEEKNAVVTESTAAPKTEKNNLPFGDQAIKPW